MESLTEHETRCLQYLNEHPTVLNGKTVTFTDICHSFKEINNVSLASDAVNSLLKKGLIAKGKMKDKGEIPQPLFYTLTLKGKNRMRQREGKRVYH